MKIIASTFLLLAVCVIGCGQTTAVTDDGRKVILKQDKTWEYAVPTTPSASNVKMITLKLDDLSQINRCAKEVDLKKSEFETNDQFQARFQNLFDSYKCGEKPLKETNIAIQVGLTYEAEDQSFYVYQLGAPIISTDQSISFITFLKGSPERKPIRGKFVVNADKARLIKPDLGIAVQGFPFSLGDVSSYFVPVKLIFFNRKTFEIYSENIIDSKIN